MTKMIQRIKGHPLAAAITFLSLLMLILGACSSGGDGGSEGLSIVEDDAAETNNTETGGNIAFGVDWLAPDEETRSLNRISGELISCETASIDQVRAEVYDENKNLLATGGPWDCTDHGGTIANVPPGPNRMVLILAQGTGDEVIYWGESERIPVQSGATADAGRITAFPIGENVNTLLSRGLENLRDGEEGEIIDAWIYLRGAVLKSRGDTGVETDAARFYQAVSRFAKLVYDQEADGVDDGYKDLGDILDAYGYPAEDRLPLDKDGLYDEVVDENGNVLFVEVISPEFPDPLPPASPDGSDLIAFLEQIVLSELKTSLGEMDRVSQTFNYVWDMELSGEVTTVENDYGDVLFFKALNKGIQAFIYILMAYHLDMDIDAYENENKTFEQFLRENDLFLRLKNGGNVHLNAAKTLVEGGLRDLLAAMDRMLQETDDQADDFISLAEETPEEIRQNRELILSAIDSLSAPALMEGEEGTADDVTIDAGTFFAGLNLRELLPSFSGDTPGFFPDPSFRGIVGPEVDLNEDLNDDYGPTPNGDGIPDILQ